MREILPLPAARPRLGLSAENHMEIAVIWFNALVFHAVPICLIKTVTRNYHHPFQAVRSTAAQIHFREAQVLRTAAGRYGKIHLLTTICG